MHRGRLRLLASSALLLCLGYAFMLEASALLAWGMVSQLAMPATEAVIASILLGFVGYVLLSLWALSLRSRTLALLLLMLLWLLAWWLGWLLSAFG